MKLLTDEARFEHEMIETYVDDQCVFAEGDVGRDLYIVQSGEVKILKKVRSELVELARFTKGDFFGDMALLQSLPRYASAHAAGASVENAAIQPSIAGNNVTANLLTIGASARFSLSETS